MSNTSSSMSQPFIAGTFSRSGSAQTAAAPASSPSAAQPAAGAGPPSLMSLPTAPVLPLAPGGGHPASNHSSPASSDFDLGTYKLDQLRLSREDWTRSLQDVFVKNMLALSPVDLMAVLVAYHTSDVPLEARLSDYEAAPLKKLCTHLLLATPPVGTSDVKGKCIVLLMDAVKRHASKHGHLIGGVSRAHAAGGDGASSQQQRTSAEVVSDHESVSGSESESKRAVSPPARRSTTSSQPQQSPRRTARNVSNTNARISKSSATAKLHFGIADVDEERSVPAALRSRDVLQALASLPSAPPTSDVRDASRHRGRRNGTSRSKSSRKQVGFSTDDSDSDSDGAVRRKKHRKQDRKQDYKRDSRDYSPPSSSSSESSSDADSDSDSHSRSRSYRSSKSARRDIVDDMETSGLAQPLAAPFIRNALSSRGGKGLIHDVMKELQFRSNRNEREVLLLARVIDALRKDNTEKALELAVRRLVGVQAADTSGNWKICDAFELVMDKQSFVPDEFLSRAIKNVRRLEALEGKKPASSSTSSGSHARGRKSAYGSARGSGSGSGGPKRDRSSDSARAAPRSGSSKGTTKESPRGDK